MLEVTIIRLCHYTTYSSLNCPHKEGPIHGVILPTLIYDPDLRITDEIEILSQSNM